MKYLAIKYTDIAQIQTNIDIATKKMILSDALKETLSEILKENKSKIVKDAKAKYFNDMTKRDERDR